MPIKNTMTWLSLRQKFRIGLAAVAMMLVASCTADIGSGSDDVFAHAPLHKAAYYNQKSTVRRLLNAGANPNARITAVGWYVMYGSVNKIRADMHGMTPLHMAVVGDARKVAIAEQLLEAGANPNAKSYAGDTPMKIVERSGSGALKRLLRSYGGR